MKNSEIFLILKSQAGLLLNFGKIKKASVNIVIKIYRKVVYVYKEVFIHVFVRSSILEIYLWFLATIKGL